LILQQLPIEANQHYHPLVLYTPPTVCSADLVISNSQFDWRIHVEEDGLTLGPSNHLQMMCHFPT